MSQHTPNGRTPASREYEAELQLSRTLAWREPYAHRLTSDDLIALSSSHDRWKQRYGWVCFALGAGFGVAALALILSLAGKL